MSKVTSSGRRRFLLPWEILFWSLLGASPWLFPYHLALLTQILIFGLFALSLDLILGYAGVLTLGHAVFFGLGAYTAGLLAVYGWGEPITGLVVAAGLSGALGLLFAPLIVRAADLTRLMITIALALVLSEAARQLVGLTGGSDGLSGIVLWPVLGQFSFDLYGRVAYIYTFVVVLLVFLVLRQVLRSTFGLNLQGIQDNPMRMQAIGVSVSLRLTQAYGVSAAVAGVAGALLAQTVQLVSVDTLGFERSAEVLIILILGGTGRLYGGFVGAIVYGVVHDQLLDLSPAYWMLGVGVLLMVVALSGHGGLMGLLARFYSRGQTS